MVDVPVPPQYIRPPYWLAVAPDNTTFFMVRSQVVPRAVSVKDAKRPPLTPAAFVNKLGEVVAARVVN